METHMKKFVSECTDDDHPHDEVLSELLDSVRKGETWMIEILLCAGVYEV